MKSVWFRSTAMVLSLITAVASAQQPAAPRSAESGTSMHLGLRGVYFVPNQGQWSDASIAYGFRTRGLDVAFRASSLTMHMTRETNESNNSTEASPKRERGGARGISHEVCLADASGSLCERADFERLTLTVTFPGSNDVMPIGAKPQAAKFNYFVGEERRAASDVPSFGKVVYPNLYDGIDLHVMGNDDGVLKYEFHVAPGADYSQIRIAYDGTHSLDVDSPGDLLNRTSSANGRRDAPAVWQMNHSSHLDIPAHFEPGGDHTARIALDGGIDSGSALFIDLEFSGLNSPQSEGYDEGSGIALDSAGNALITGRTTSIDFAGRNNAEGGNQDAFVAKVSPSGILQWMTYVGGSDFDHAYGIAVDGAGNSLVTGVTASIDFNGRKNEHEGGYSHYDAFALRVSPAGALQWMVYLGGSGYDEGWCIATDDAGNALVSGRTESIDFEGRNNVCHGDRDAYVAKVSPTGALQWMTYLGGSDYDAGSGIAVNSDGETLVAGSTRSNDFKGQINTYHDGGLDAYVARVSASGMIQWMTYLGGNGRDEGNAIALDQADNALVTGYTESTDFEGRNNAYRFYDAFVVKVNARGAVEWMTYLAGDDYDEGHGIAVDSAGNALVSGETRSIDFERRNNKHHGGNSDAILFKVSHAGALEWATYLGGSGDRYERGYAVAVDGADNAWVTGYSNSRDFEGRNNAYHGGTWDAFALKVSASGILQWMTYLGGGGEGIPQLTATATCPSGGPIQLSWTGATGGGEIAILFARNTGSATIPNGNPCAGTVLGLGSNQIQIAYQGSAGANGSRTVNSTTGPGACGGYLQLLDLTTCTTSNVARIE